LTEYVSLYRSLIESIDPTIRVARGYTCSSVEDLLGAYALLECERVVVKPIHGAAGEGILFLKSVKELSEYTFPMGDVCLEEHLNLDVAPDGVVLSPALHYNEGELVGEDLVDQIMNGTAYMGWRRTVAPAPFQMRARDILRRFMDHTQPRGPGGVDFLSVDGEPYLSDLNTVRLLSSLHALIIVSLTDLGSGSLQWMPWPEALPPCPSS
jgi:predicted ATP-grasp superfamily ATP-dependent carboligase